MCWLRGKIRSQQRKTLSRWTLPSRRHSRSTAPPAGWIVEYPPMQTIWMETVPTRETKAFLFLTWPRSTPLSSSFLVYFHALTPRPQLLPTPSFGSLLYQSLISHGIDKSRKVAEVKSHGQPPSGCRDPDSAEVVPNCGELKLSNQTPRIQTRGRNWRWEGG